VTRSVIVTIRAMRGLWSVPHLRVLQTDTFVDVMSIIRAATVNSPSIKLVLHRGGDRPSVGPATVQRIEVLIRVATSERDSATAGYVSVNSAVICCLRYDTDVQNAADFN